MNILRIKQIILLVAFILMTAVETFASKAMPFTMQVTLQDGRNVVVSLKGDENVSFYVTSEGEIIIREGDIFRAATQEETDDIKASIKELEQNNHEAMAKAANGLVTDSNEGVTGTRLFPHVGTTKVPVIMVSFSDLSLTFEKEDIDSLLNGKTVLKARTSLKSYGSVAKYFSDCSDGQFCPQFDVYGPYTVPQAMSYYGANSSNGKTKDLNISDLIKHACNAANSDIDFSQYDSNNDGYVDLLYVIYAGHGENGGANSNSIWAKSGTTSVSQTYDGKKLYRYGVNAELMGNSNYIDGEGNYLLNGIGVFCHEFSHTLGLPDFYPTVDMTFAQYDNQSMEDWDLMDNGENCTNGCWPPMYTAFEKELMGWGKLDTLDTPSDVTLTPLLHGGKAYRILNDNDKTGNEYWILEAISNGNISQKWHAYMRGKGMLVTHVNYNATNFTLEYNSVNNTVGKSGITIIPADDYLPSSWRVTNNETLLQNSDYMSAATYYAQLAGDTYPGSQGITEFNNYKAYTGTIDKPITEITQNADFSVSFKFMGGTPPLMGDANDDGFITMADANLVVNYFLATEKSTININLEAANVNGDTNEDGTPAITMADANQIVNMFLNNGQ